MALKLVQVLDLAIGVDNASVNILHLRKVLMTVIKTLDIEHVTVKNVQEEIRESVLEDHELKNDRMLPDDTAQENSPGDKDEILPSSLADDSRRVIVKNENEDVENENDSKYHASNDNSQKHKTKSQTSDPPKLKRSESAFSKVSNIPAQLSNSTLASKVFLLEENLKRLQTIVGSLILQDEAGNEESQSIASLLGNVQNEYGEINTSMGLECEQVADPRLGRGVSKEDMSEILANDELSRPVTQPVLTSVNLKSDLPRSKTASILSRKKKQFRRQGSMPVKLRHVATIKEDVQQNFQEITREKTEDKKEEMVESKENIGRDTRIGDDIGQEETQPNEEYLLSDEDSDTDIEAAIEHEIQIALSDPSDPKNTTYALRLGLEQMQRWRKEFQMVQDNFKFEVEECREYIRSLEEDLKLLKTEKKHQQETEQFNILHQVYRQINELDQKQIRMSKTVNGLVDEYNRHETAVSEILNSIGKLEEQKVDKILLTTQVNDKANKDELRDKVSLTMFDESLSLLDQALNDALEKMENQMSIEEALRETLNDLQSGMEMKLNREDMETLKSELETRIKEVRAAQEKGLIEKNHIPKDPAGFKRFIEKVRCISCDCDVEIDPLRTPIQPSLPKTQPLAGIPRSRDVHLKHTTDELCRLSKLKPEVIRRNGFQVQFPPSQRFCGGRHTITRGNKRFLGPTLSDYIVIRESDHVSLPPREFIVAKDSGLPRMMKRKLPSITENKDVMVPREEKNVSKDNSEDYVLQSDKDELVIPFGK